MNEFTDHDVKIKRIEAIMTPVLLEREVKAKIYASLGYTPLTIG